MRSRFVWQDLPAVLGSPDLLRLPFLCSIGAVTAPKSVASPAVT
jgi:hypothetical protein